MVFRLAALLALLLAAAPVPADASDTPEVLVIVGAGYAPPWDTDFALANREQRLFQAWIGPGRSSLAGCLSCPGASVFLPPDGTGRVTAQAALWVHAQVSAVRTFYVVPPRGVSPPSVTARIVNRDR